MSNTLGLLYKSLCNKYFAKRLRWRIFFSNFARASLTFQHGNNNNVLCRVFYCISDVLISD
jgi:hypothetical protein